MKKTIKKMTKMRSRAKDSAAAKRIGDSTIAIHVGEDHFGVGAPVGTPIARTANFTFASTEEMKRWAEGKSSAYIYTRYGNPTLAMAEEKVAALEGAEAAVVTASGSAAISSAAVQEVVSRMRRAPKRSSISFCARRVNGPSPLA